MKLAHREQEAFEPLVAVRHVQQRAERGLEALVKCGALDSTGASRMGMLACLEQALAWGQKHAADRLAGQASIFDLKTKRGRSLALADVGFANDHSIGSKEAGSVDPLSREGGKTQVSSRSAPAVLDRP